MIDQPFYDALKIFMEPDFGLSDAAHMATAVDDGGIEVQGIAHRAMRDPASLSAREIRTLGIALLAKTAASASKLKQKGEV